MPSDICAITNHLRLILIGIPITALSACYSGTDDTAPIVIDDAYYAELAQNFEPFVPDLSIGAALDPEDYVSQGRWSEVIDWPEIATGAANLPDGRLMTWASTSKETFGTTNNFTFGSIYDPSTGTFADENNNFHNTFCAGVSMLPDGRVIAAGGGATVTKTSIFDLASNDWALTNDLNHARWYATTTTLPSGQALTALGTNVPYSEIWTEGTGWDVRTNLSLQSVINDNSAPSSQRNWYPALNVAPDGSLFHAGPTSELFSLYLGEDEGLVYHGDRESGDPFRLYNTTVMYDVGKMLIAGGGKPALSSAMTVDLNGPSPAVSATNSMNHSRSMHNSIVLPNGKVMVIGGNSTGIQFSDQGSQLTPELWDPDTGVWQELAQHIVPRNYHSTALLMKDARVAALGGGLCGGCPSNHKNGQFYEPPYLFNTDGSTAARPTITNGEAIATVGDVVNIQGSSDIVKFNMVRLVALTHHHTTDQRLVPLAIQSAEDGYYQLSIPANQNVVIPGYYWIFGFNNAGVPTVGHTIKINVNTEANTNTIAGTGVVDYEYYEGEWFSLPNFDFLTPKTVGKLDEFNLTPAQRADDFAIRFTSKVYIPENGLYTFHIASDDGSQLLINDQLVVDHDGLHAATEKQGGVILSEGLHDIEVRYFELKGDQSLAVSWTGPGFSKTDISTNLTTGLSELQNPDNTDDDTDNSNEPSAAAPTGVSNGSSLVSIEAENYDSLSASSTHSWTTTSLFNSSNNAAIVTTPDSGALTPGSTGSPSVEYTGMFDQPGIWYVWLRGWGDTNTQGEGSSDSVHAGLNGQLSTTADNIDYFPAGWNWSNSTRDGARASITIPSAGEHKFNLWMREDGLAIDKIVLTTDSTYIPSDSGPAVTSGTTISNGNTDQDPDPATSQQTVIDANEQWQYHQTADGSTVTARHEAGGVALNGKLYVLGGRGTRNVSVFDPVLNSWTYKSAAPLELNHYQPVAWNNKIWVLGAFTGGYPDETSVANIYTYTPDTDQWAVAGTIPAERRRGSAGAVLHDNIIYLVGGNTNGHRNGAKPWLDAYNPQSGEWQTLPDAPTARDHATVAVSNGKLVVAAGRQSAFPNTFGNMLATTNVYDLTTGVWSTAADIPTQRAGTMTVDVGEEVIVIGGESAGIATARNNVEAYNVVSDTWRALDSLGTGRHGGAAAVLDGKIHVISGSENLGGAPESLDHETLVVPAPVLPPQLFVCNGKPVTVLISAGDTPTSGDDVILGTDGDDVINAMGGNDTICALDGNDTINAGNGFDWVDSGPGDDIVDGGNDNDTIFGDTGMDTLSGGPGNDEIYGEDDGDFINGNSGDDTLEGGDGIDQILGGSGDDNIDTGAGGNRGTGRIVDAGAGNDTVTGGTDDDEIRAATGNDVINGSAGDDALFGGGGNDTISGNSGDDLIRGNGSNDIIYGGNGNDDIDGGSGIDTLYGGNDDDTIRGSTGNDVLYGGADNDIIYGGGGIDTLYGNRGDDQLIGGGSIDNLHGGSDTDSCQDDEDVSFFCEPLSDQ